MNQIYTAKKNEERILACFNKKHITIILLFNFLIALGNMSTLQAQTSPGSNDASFNIGTGFDNPVYSVAQQPDGKLVVGGGFYSYNGTGSSRIARLNADGTLDASFRSNFDSSVRSVALQPDGKVVAAGEFYKHIARLNADGTLDASFDPGTNFINGIYSVALQPDGKVVVGGVFSYNGTTRKYIARLNADGTLDASFDPGMGFNSTIFSVALQPDGKVVVGGAFTSFNGTTRNYIARLNADGTLDASFDASLDGMMFSSVRSVALQPDGKVVVGGWFTSNGGGPGIARLNADGTLDTSFDPGTGFNGTISSVTQQPDGKVVVGGWFTSYNGTSRNKIARLNVDGTLDASFDPGTGFNLAVYSVALQPDGKVVVGGEFNSYNGTARSKIARLYGEIVNTAPVLAAIGPQSVDELTQLTFQASATDDGLPNNTLIYSLASAASGTYPTGASITAAGAFSWTPTAAQGPGTYRVKVIVSDGELTDEEEIEIQVNDIRAAPVLSKNASCWPDATLNLSNAADASKIVWYKGNEVVATILPTPALQGTTVAGGNGQGAAINQLNQPYEIHVEDNGDIYVVDAANNRIQKWENGGAEGVTIAGGNGQGASANQFNIPTSIFVDINGNIYVADGGNHRVQKWAPGASSGVTVAGGNGQGAAANQFYSIQGIFVDGNNNIYVADAFNYRVQKWAPGAASGVTVAGGNGQGAASNQLGLPTGVFVDGAGNVYVVDAGNNRIQKWATGSISGTTVAGGNGSGSAANQLSIPSRLFMRGNALYVSDRGNSRIQRWELGGIEGVTVAGGNGQGAAANQFNVPLGIYVDLSGNIYVADAANHRIQKWAAPTIATTYTPTTAGEYKAIIIYGTETITTNTVSITEGLPVSVSISADPSTTVVAGTSVTFTATPTNGGESPAYQWKVNGAEVIGETSPTYTTSTLANGDVVTAVLTSNAPCVISNPATSNSLTMTVNAAPILAAIGNKNINELTALIFQASANDDGLPNNTLTYSLASAATGTHPAGAVITSSGAFSWTPTEAQGPGTYRVKVVVSDGELSDDKEIEIVVNEVNTAPVLSTISAKTVNELAQLAFTATAEDSDLPANSLSFSLIDAPEGASITPAGDFTWTPTEAQGPGSYTLTVKVTDNGTPALSDEKVVTITVNEVNSAPVLAAIEDKSVSVGSTLSFTVSATDSDIPVQTLTYSASNLPTGATFVPDTRTFSWTPTGNQTGDHFVTIHVSDGSLSDSKVAKITVTKAVALKPSISSFTPSSGSVNTSVTITGSNLGGATLVTFNGVSAPILSNSSTTIETRVPSGATSGRIAVTTTGGTATSKQSFTVTTTTPPTPAPTISGFSPSSGSINTPVTITGSNLGGATLVTFNGVSAPILSNSSATIETRVPSGATSGRIAVTTPGGTATSKQSFKVTGPSIASALQASEPTETLFEVYPNPFSGTTTIAFSLNEGENYALEIFDMRGALVKRLAAGTAESNKVYEFELTGNGMAEGIYITRLSTSSMVQSLKTILKR